MSRPTGVIVLCEDRRTFQFVYSYLKLCGIRRGVRPVISPRGRGCGFDFVVDNFAAQANAYKLANSRKETWLFAVVDADTGTVEQRIGQMVVALNSAQEERVRAMNIENEKIARLIPRRNIETWILALNSKAVNETDDYKRGMDDGSWLELIPPATGTLYRLTRPNAQLPQSLIASLRHATNEIVRVFRLAR